MTDLRTQIANRATQAMTGALKAVGARERVLRWRQDRARANRRALEARGDDSLSHPSLHELDRKLDRIIDRDDGFFVEAGGHDGFTQSNSYWLERFRRWRGILVEPMPELAAEARLSRPGATVFQCALAAEAGGTVSMRFGDLYSIVDGAKESAWPRSGTFLGWRDSYTLEVEASTLSSLLDTAGAPEVDLLSLDVEGFEAEVLQGLDLDRHAPRYVLVELHDPEHEQPAIDAVLGDRYAIHGWLSPADLLYVRRDVGAPSPPSAPPA